MQLQSGTGTYRTFAESRLMRPDPAPDLQTAQAGPARGSSRVAASHPGMTRHAVAPGRACRLKPEPGSPSGSCLQHPDDCDRVRGDIRRSQPSPCPSLPTGARKAPARPSGCRKSSLMPVPRRVRAEFAAPYVTGYKLSLSGGFLFRASRSAGVQNVIFAGVFVPQVWNTTCHRSASSIRPVGCRHRLYHAAPAPDAAFCSSCKVLYTSMTSPKAAKSPCHERGAHAAPPSGHYPTPCRQRDSNASRTLVQGCRGSFMNPLTGAYPGPTWAIMLVSTADFTYGRQCPAGEVERIERRWTRHARCEETD